jgi:uncharacterized protein with HEPN domain
MSRRDDLTLLGDMLNRSESALAAVRGRSREEFLSDPVLAAAVERFLEVIGEAASKVSDETRHVMPHIPWADIVGLRHRLVHVYFGIDAKILWGIVSDDLPILVRDLRRVVGP